MLHVGEYKGIIVLALFLCCIFLIRIKGPVFLLYLFGVFGWFGGYIINWGPLTPIFTEMPIPEFTILGALFFSFFLIRKIYVPFLLLLMLFWLFCAYVWIVGILPDIKYAWFFTRKSVIMPVIAYISAYLLLDSTRKRELMMISIIGGVSLISLIALITIITIITLKPDSFMQIIMSERFNFNVVFPIIGGVQLTGNIITVYSSMAATSWFVIFLTQSKTRKNIKQLSILGFSLAIGVIFATGCRTPIIAVITSISIILFFNFKQKITKRMLYWSFGIIGIAILMKVFSKIGLLTNTSSERIHDTVQLLNSPISYFFESNHGQNWLAFLEAAPHYIFGAGFFVTMDEIGGPAISPHSQYAYLYLGTGLLGMTIYFGVILIAVIYGLRFRSTFSQENWTILACSAGIITYFFSAAMIHTVAVNGADIYTYILAAIIIRQVNEKKIKLQKLKRFESNSLTRSLMVYCSKIGGLRNDERLYF